MSESFLVIYIDGDACPVRNEVYRVAERHQLLTRVVCNSMIRIPDTFLVELHLVSKDMDAADNWIVEHVSAGDIVITTDIPLAARCLEKDAKVLGPNGKVLNDQSIGSALAMRNLMEDIRDSSELRQMHRPFGKQDRIKFLDALEKTVQMAKRSAHS